MRGRQGQLSGELLHKRAGGNSLGGMLEEEIKTELQRDFRFSNFRDEDVI